MQYGIPLKQQKTLSNWLKRHSCSLPRFKILPKYCRILQVMSTLHKSWSKVTFPISLQLKGTRLPQENWCCFRLTIIIRLGLYYVYICIDCQSSILSHIVPELINHLICWNCKGCIGKSIGPVQYRFTIPSLLAQRLVAGSIFWTKKTKRTKHGKKLSQLHALEPARYAVIIPGQYILCVRFFSFHIRSPAQRDVFRAFFRTKNWASSMPSS